MLPILLPINHNSLWESAKSSACTLLKLQTLVATEAQSDIRIEPVRKLCTPKGNCSR